MLVDHIGFIMFPKIQWLRWIGRLAMPIFAFFVAEGCLKSSDRTKYFKRMLLLGIACQIVYLLEQLSGGGIREVYLNILLSFSLAILLGSAWLEGRKGSVYSSLALLAAFEVFCCFSKDLTGVKVTMDYGLFSVLIPLYVVISGGKNKKWDMFIVMAFYAVAASFDMWYAWMSLLALPLLAMYNGERGKMNLKYFFYGFYPVHLAVIYAFNMILK